MQVRFIVIYSCFLLHPNTIPSTEIFNTFSLLIYFHSPSGTWSLAKAIVNNAVPII